MAEKTIQLITRRQTDLNSRLSNFVLRPDDKYCEMTATTGNAMFDASLSSGYKEKGLFVTGKIRLHYISLRLAGSESVGIDG
ncbi:hypothetical protein Q9189_000003 [Teloschistes chrysophthalmus]